jgi:anaerobic magnesium-protoporphyrin IX monomethyl ester cyclase
MKIALINPQTETLRMRELYDWHENYALGLMYASIIHNAPSCQVTLFDLRVDNMSERDLVINHQINQYDVLVFSVNYATLQSALLMIQMIVLESGVCPTIVMGGEHASYLSDELMTQYPEIDIICHGEAESTISQLLIALDKKIPLSLTKGITFRNGDDVVRCQPNDSISQLDTLPYCDHSIAERAIQRGKCIEIGILSKRGCPYPCAFCNAQRFLGNETTGVRYRSPENVVNEIAGIAPLVKQSGGYLRFYDATFVTPSKMDRQWVTTFCELMEARQLRVPIDVFIRSDSVNIRKEKDQVLLERLRNIGVISTYIGLEAGDNVQLEMYNKKINSSESMQVYQHLKYMGMAGATNGFINFFQGSTLTQIRQNVAFLAQTGFATFWNILSRAETLPGIKINGDTDMYDRQFAWDVTNYQFTDLHVAQLYRFLTAICDNHYFVRYEDRIVRKIRDGIKIKQFYLGYAGYSEDERGFDDRIVNLQMNTQVFILEVIQRIEEEHTLSIHSAFVRQYIQEMNQNLRAISTQFKDYLS